MSDILQKVRQTTNREQASFPPQDAPLRSERSGYPDPSPTFPRFTLITLHAWARSPRAYLAVFLGITVKEMIF